MPSAIVTHNSSFEYHSVWPASTTGDENKQENWSRGKPVILHSKVLWFGSLVNWCYFLPSNDCNIPRVQPRWSTLIPIMCAVGILMWMSCARGGLKLLRLLQSLEWTWSEGWKKLRLTSSWIDRYICTCSSSERWVAWPHWQGSSRLRSGLSVFRSCKMSCLTALAKLFWARHGLSVLRFYKMSGLTSEKSLLVYKFDMNDVCFSFVGGVVWPQRQAFSKLDVDYVFRFCGLSGLTVSRRLVEFRPAWSVFHFCGMHGLTTKSSLPQNRHVRSVSYFSGWLDWPHAQQTCPKAEVDDLRVDFVRSYASVTWHNRTDRRRTLFFRTIPEWHTVY